MFYDEVIEKHEENKWHVVTDKSKNKNKNKYGQSEQFLQSHLVKDNKFNQMMSDFVKVFTAEEEANEGLSLEPVEILRQLG